VNSKLEDKFDCWENDSDIKADFVNIDNFACAYFTVVLLRLDVVGSFYLLTNILLLHIFAVAMQIHLTTIIQCEYLYICKTGYNFCNKKLSLTVIQE